MIVAVGLEPTDWFYHSHDVYDYFHANQLSLGYMASILKLANLWESFICRKFRKPFNPVPLPKGYERQRLLEAFYSKESRNRTPSGPLTPETLASTRGRLNQPNFNWLFVSVWFGLRPLEIDNLVDSSMWKVETLPTGRQILWVYQTKIIALPPEDRWKPIPILFDEQRFALKLINDGKFKRPLSKTIRKYFGDGVDLYGGRKGFVDLMISKGHVMENVSIWMGHLTLSRTWRSYKNKKLFHL